MRSILNFAPAVVTVPEHVSVRKVDLSVELQILAYYEQRGAEAREVSADREPDQERDNDDHDREQDELHRALIEQRHVGERIETSSLLLSRSVPGRRGAADKELLARSFGAIQQRDVHDQQDRRADQKISE